MLHELQRDFIGCHIEARRSTVTDRQVHSEDGLDTMTDDSAPRAHPRIGRCQRLPTRGRTGTCHLQWSRTCSPVDLRSSARWAAQTCLYPWRVRRKLVSKNTAAIEKATSTTKRWWREPATCANCGEDFRAEPCIRASCIGAPCIAGPSVHRKADGCLSGCGSRVTRRNAVCVYTRQRKRVGVLGSD